MRYGYEQLDWWKSIGLNLNTDRWFHLSADNNYVTHVSTFYCITENYNKNETVFQCSGLIKHKSFCWIYFEGRFFFKLTSKTHYIFTKFISFWQKVTNIVYPVRIERTAYNQSEESIDPNCTLRRDIDAVLLPAQIFLSADKNFIMKEWVWGSPTRTNCVCEQNKMSTRLRWWMFARTLASSIFFLF